MKNKLSLLLIAIVFACLAITVYSQVQKTATAGQGWEYQEIQLSQTESSLPKLNPLGTQGWELVGVMSACRDVSAVSTIRNEQCEYWAYLKRRK